MCFFDYTGFYRIFGAKIVISLNIGFSNLLFTLTSSSLIFIPCGQCDSHFPHFLQREAMDFSFFIPVHMKYSLIPFAYPSVYETLYVLKQPGISTPAGHGIQ